MRLVAHRRLRLRFDDRHPKSDRLLAHALLVRQSVRCDTTSHISPRLALLVFVWVAPRHRDILSLDALCLRLGTGAERARLLGDGFSGDRDAHLPVMAFGAALFDRQLDRFTDRLTHARGQPLHAEKPGGLAFEVFPRKTELLVQDVDDSIDPLDERDVLEVSTVFQGRTGNTDNRETGRIDANRPEHTSIDFDGLRLNRLRADIRETVAEASGDTLITEPLGDSTQGDFLHDRSLYLDDLAERFDRSGRR